MCLNLCGLPTPPSESELAEAFATTVPKRFEFWSGNLTMVNLGVEEAAADVDSVRFPFRCSMAFDRPVVITYGERDYSAAVKVHGQRLEHWLAALSLPSLPDHRYLHTPARIDEYASAAARAISEHWSLLEAPGEGLVTTVSDAAEDLPRHERLDQAQAAFADKNFERVVELLSPLEGELFRSDERRLVKARKKTG